MAAVETQKIGEKIIDIYSIFIQYLDENWNVFWISRINGLHFFYQDGKPNISFLWMQEKLSTVMYRINISTIFQYANKSFYIDAG